MRIPAVGTPAEIAYIRKDDTFSIMGQFTTNGLLLDKWKAAREAEAKARMLFGAGQIPEAIQTLNAYFDSISAKRDPEHGILKVMFKFNQAKIMFNTAGPLRSDFMAHFLAVQELCGNSSYNISPQNIINIKVEIAFCYLRLKKVKEAQRIMNLIANEVLTIDEGFVFDKYTRECSVLLNQSSHSSPLSGPQKKETSLIPRLSSKHPDKYENGEHRSSTLGRSEIKRSASDSHSLSLSSFLKPDSKKNPDQDMVAYSPPSGSLMGDDEDRVDSQESQLSIDSSSSQSSQSSQSSSGVRRGSDSDSSPDPAKGGINPYKFPFARLPDAVRPADKFPQFALSYSPPDKDA